MSAASFARRKGISARRLAYWKTRLAESGPVSFVSLPLPVRPSSVPATERAHIEIACDDIVLRVREDIDVEQLARIAFALGARTRRC